jgi:ankyrin repeat protein
MEVLRAAAVGDLKAVRKWLTAPHPRNRARIMQVLNRAAEYGHDNICQLILDNEEVPEEAMALALNTACMYNRQSTAQLLLRHGHLDIHNLIEAAEALFAACACGHVRIVAWLISDVMNLSQSDRIKWLFTTACACGDLNVVKQLVTQVDSDVTRVMSQSLRVACCKSRNDVVKWLMSHTTVDVSSRGVILKLYGEVTSLMIACHGGHNEIVRQLLQCVTPHTVNMVSGNIANTALHFAICCVTDESSRMQHARANGDIATAAATLFLSNLDLQGYFDFTDLHYACYRGDVEIVRMLLSAFADTHITNENRHTPTMLAEMHGHTELLPYLRCTLSDPPDNSVHVSNNNNNNSVSISMLSVEDVTQHNTPHTNSSRPGTISKFTKRSKIRIV